MEKSVKQKWIAALRSGNFKQGRSFLRDEQDNCCCLGVLLDICGAKWSFVDKPLYDVKAYKSDLSDHRMPSLEFDASVGLRNAGDLAVLNDSGKSFEQIADWIEENL